MQTAYMVVAGAHEDFKVIRVFEIQYAAEMYALQYNNDVPWSNADDKARVEDVEFVSVSTSVAAAQREEQQ